VGGLAATGGTGPDMRQQAQSMRKSIRKAIRMRKIMRKCIRGAASDRFGQFLLSPLRVRKFAIDSRSFKRGSSHGNIARQQNITKQNRCEVQIWQH